MPFELRFTNAAQEELIALSKDKHRKKRFNAVRKSLRFLAENPAHPSLHTHKYESFVGPGDTDVFEAYAENNTPGAYRIFWCYFPPKKKEDSIGTITILAVTPHP